MYFGSVTVAFHSSSSAQPFCPAQDRVADAVAVFGDLFEVESTAAVSYPQSRLSAYYFQVDADRGLTVANGVGAGFASNVREGDGVWSWFHVAYGYDFDGDGIEVFDFGNLFGYQC